MMFKTHSHPAAEPRNHYFGALTPAMIDHLRQRAALNAQRPPAQIERSLEAPAYGFPPVKDWQD